MPFIPHTEKDTREMLDTIGVKSIADLFDEIPPALRIAGLDGIGPALSEAEVSRLLQRRARAEVQNPAP